VNPQDLMFRSIVRSLKTPGVLVTGAVALAMSAGVLNPLPSILWAICSVGWAIKGLSSGRYQNEIAREYYEEERAEKGRKTEYEQSSLVRQITGIGKQSPFTDWVSQKLLPDYLMQFEGLKGMRDAVADVAHNRREIEDPMETDIVSKLDAMLASYLKFVLARFMYIKILTGQQLHSAPADSGNGEQGEYGFNPLQPRARSRQTRQEPKLFDLDAKIQELEARIATLEKKKIQKPATATVCDQHIDLLQRRMQMMRECAERDARVEAQLETFPDAFEIIQARVSATEFSPSEITTYLGSVVSQVEETQKFVESLRPVMDTEMGGLDMAFLSTTEGGR